MNPDRLKQIELNGNSNYSKTLGINIKIKQKGIYVYPNPVVHEANINLYSSKIAPANIILVNDAGKVVFNKVWKLQIGNNVTNLNLASITPGSYWLKVIGNDICEIQQIIKK